MLEQLEAQNAQLLKQRTTVNDENVNSHKKESPQKAQSKIPKTSNIPAPNKIEKRIFTEKTQEQLNSQQNMEDFSDEEGETIHAHKNTNNQAEENEQPLDEDADDYSLVFPEKYHGEESEKAEVVQESEGTKGKIFRLYDNDKREILFANGVRKEIFPDGYSIVYFSNDDIKQIYPDGKTVYYFADAGTAQTTMPDGLKIYKFNNEQVEKHYVDGTKEIIFPNGTVKYIFDVNDEESIFTDGTIQRLTPDGMKVVEYPSGQKDIIYPDGTKERQYSTGKVKKMNPDGKIESYTLNE